MVCNETAEEAEAASSRAGLSLYTIGGGRVVALPMLRCLYFLFGVLLNVILIVAVSESKVSQSFILAIDDETGHIVSEASRGCLE